MRKILCMILCLVMLASLAIMTNAEAMNMAGGCTTSVVIKKANSAAVVKDGVIGAGEYEEVVINRDANTTDILFAWDDTVNFATLLEQCGEFLQNVHFYFSWDEVNGLNIAIKATLLETPYSNAEQPAADRMTDENGSPIPGDEFVFQFGAIFSVSDNDGIVIYRGLGYNTETGTPLTGHYGKNGYTGSYNLVEGKNYAVKIEGNTVTYEISYPIASVVKAADMVGNAPAEDTEIQFNITATGGSTGNYHDGNITYSAALGDKGFMYNMWAGTNLDHAHGSFSYEAIPYAQATVTTPVATTEPETAIVTSHVAVTTVDEAGNVVEVTNADGSVVTEVVSEVVTVAPTTTPGQGTQSPTTGDPMIIAAVVAAISACGIVVAKKRK